MGTPSNISPSSSKADSEALEKSREALKSWAQRHRGLLEIFLDAYCLVDVTNSVVDFNVAFTELCGESYRKVHKIADFCELVKTERCPGQCPARQVATTLRAVRVDELAGVTKAFPSLQMILGAVPVFDEEGTFIGSLVTIRNVSAESELQRKYDERKKESVTDGMTRLFNKVYTESMLVKMLQGSFREVQTLSLVLCDIDHFKRVNDTFGHRAGDHVLTTVAQLLKGESRESDVVGRFGGEEFLAILANSERTGAKVFAERFRKRIEGMQIYFDGKHIPVTVSLGTATFADRDKRPTASAAEQLAKELINRADLALYTAKADGRNQTRQFELLNPAEVGALTLPPKKKADG